MEADFVLKSLKQDSKGLFSDLDKKKKVFISWSFHNIGELYCLVSQGA